MKIVDHDFDAPDVVPEVVTVERTSLHVIHFTWPCGEQFDVKRIALMKLLTGLFTVRGVEGLRVALTHPEAVRGYRWNGAPGKWCGLTLSRDRAHIRARVVEPCGLAGATAKFLHRELRETTRLERES